MTHIISGIDGVAYVLMQAKRMSSYQVRKSAIFAKIRQRTRRGKSHISIHPKYKCTFGTTYVCSPVLTPSPALKEIPQIEITA